VSVGGFAAWWCMRWVGWVSDVSSGCSVGVDPGGWVEGGQSVAFDVDVPAVVVDHAVVMPAEQHEEKPCVDNNFPRPHDRNAWSLDAERRDDRVPQPSPPTKISSSGEKVEPTPLSHRNQRSCRAIDANAADEAMDTDQDL